MSKKKWPIFYSNLLYKMGHYTSGTLSKSQRISFDSYTFLFSILIWRKQIKITLFFIILLLMIYMYWFSCTSI